MSSFEDSIARMKALYTYGKVDESKKQSNSTLEYSAKAADGKTYGIVKECNHFYIKQAVNGKENIAEGYDYIGGYMNKNNYKYDSYANALKHFELKLGSINEAHDAKVNVSTLDPFKKQDIIAEATDKMKEEIARQRQIMYNASMIMNESADYAVKGGNACTTVQPEAETGKKGDKVEGSTDAKANPDYEGSHISLEKKAEPFKENPGKGKDMNESCEGGSCDTDFDAGLKSFGSTENGEADTDHNNDPFTQSVNEEGEKEWDKGLPGSAGVGEADTDHNNDPFNKTVNESEEGVVDDVDVEDDADDADDVDDIDDFDFDDDVDLDVDVEDDVDDADFDVELDADAEGDEVVDDTVDDDEADVVDESDPESVRNEIERLQGVLAGLEGEEADELSDDAVADAELGDDVDAADDMDAADAEEDAAVEDELGSEGIDVEDTDFDEGLDDEYSDDDDDFQFESKRNFMNQIVESVVKSILSEDELHDFGKHPGYRKKPMDLPPTGEDKNEHGEDINDESVHNEEPFGKQIGDSSPFNQLVNAVAKDVMYQLKHGVPLDNKKKVE